MIQQRFQKAEYTAWIGIATNIALALTKGSIGLSAGSRVLIADAAHSFSEAAGAFASLGRLRAAKQRPDEGRPFRPGRTDTAASIIVATIILLLGIEVGISSGKAIYYGTEKPPAAYALIAIVISMIVKEAIFRYQYRVGRQLGSDTLITNAWAYRSDVYSSLAAIAGIGGALLGKYFGIGYLVYLDPVAGVIVSMMVLKMGYSMIMEVIHHSQEDVLRQEDAEELLKTVQRIKGVIAVDEINAREHGHYVLVDLKISVNPRISVMEGHDIAKIVKMTLMKRFIHVSDVFIHVNPYDPGYPYKNNVDSEQNDAPTVLH